MSDFVIKYAQACNVFNEMQNCSRSGIVFLINALGKLMS